MHYTGIREIVRSELSEGDFAGGTADTMLLGFFGSLSLLILRRLPRRFRDG